MDAHDFEKVIGYKFKNTKLLTAALTHSSYSNEHRSSDIICNERLEFLGDSVLGFICAELLYTRYSDKTEGVMSKMRSALVCEAALAEYAKCLELGKYLLLGRGEVLAGAGERASTVSDAFEAVIAAIYLDGGIDDAKNFVLPFLNSAIDNNKHTHSLNRDFKTSLQEISQKNPGEIIRYELTNESGPDHTKVFTVSVYLNSNLLATAHGKSKKEAEQSAAREALKLMGEKI